MVLAHGRSHFWKDFFLEQELAHTEGSKTQGHAHLEVSSLVPCANPGQTLMSTAGHGIQRQTEGLLL